MVMYGVYTADTLEKLIEMVHKMQNKTSWYEKVYSGTIKDWYHWYLTYNGMGHYAINTLLYPRMVQEKYIKMYERFVNQLKEYARAIRILSKGYLAINLLPPSKLAKLLDEVKQTFLKTNKTMD